MPTSAASSPPPQVTVDDTEGSNKTPACPTFRFQKFVTSTGNSPEAQAERGLLRCAQEVVRAMYVEREVVMSLYNLVKEREEKRQAKGGEDGDDCFTKEVSTLRSLDADWVLNYVKKHSGLTTDQLVKAKSHDDDALTCLLAYDIDAALTQSLPKELQNKPVALECFERLRQKVKTPLSDFKDRGGLRPDGSVDWKAGAYLPTVQQGNIVTLTHRASGETADLTGLGITSSYSLRDNWCSASANLSRPPLPPVRCATLFVKGRGPNVTAAAKVKTINAAVAEAVAAVGAKKKVVDGGLSTGDEAKKALDKLQGEKRTKLAAEAREKVKETLAKRRKSSSIDLSK